MPALVLCSEAFNTCVMIARSAIPDDMTRSECQFSLVKAFNSAKRSATT